MSSWYRGDALWVDAFSVSLEETRANAAEQAEEGIMVAHLGPDDGAVDAVVVDFDGDLSVRQVRPDEGGLDFNVGLFLGVQDVPEGKEATVWSTRFLVRC